jgi:ABC-type branched-subunit amino acid transport system substrate-binding protein
VPWLAVLVLAGVAGCAPRSPGDGIRLGLLLSYTGNLAADSINSERAVLMAIESVNEAGGVAGLPLRVIARDTGSDSASVSDSARALLDRQVDMLIGPDTLDLALQVRPLWQDRTIILPSFHTSSDILFRPSSWFVMGAATSRVACELIAQLRNDRRQHPVVIVSSDDGYNSELAWELVRRYGMPKVTLPSDPLATASSVLDITAQSADALVLVAPPPSAASLVYAMSAVGALDDPSRWYLSPTLHTPALLESIPKGALDGARGVSPGTVGAGDFRARFAARWQDAPLDDAYSFYDAAAVAALAIARAAVQQGTVPDGTGLSAHIRAVTRAGGRQVQWSELGRGLALVAGGEEIEYVGLSGPIQFDDSGQTPSANTKWWTIGHDAFQDIPASSECR